MGLLIFFFFFFFFFFFLKKKKKKKNCLFLILASAALGMPPPQEILLSGKACKAITDDTERLKCFDGLFGETREATKSSGRKAGGLVYRRDQVTN